MGPRRPLAVLLSAAYLGGIFLVPALHSTEPGAHHGTRRTAHPSCVDHAHGVLQAPCPARGPCDNPNHDHGGRAAGHAVPCPRCSGAFGATLAAATQAAPRSAADPAQHLHIDDSTPLSLLLPLAGAARAPPLSS
jgi:hypothetical protein